MHGAHRAGLSDRLTRPGGALEDQHDLLAREAGHQPLVQPVRGARPVAPPAVRSAAHHVGGVDDQHPVPAGTAAAQGSDPFGSKPGQLGTGSRG